MTEVVEQIIETTENHTVDGLEVACEVTDNLVEYVGELDYTRPFTFSASFNLNELNSLTKKEVRTALISSAVYKDDGSPVNGFVAQNARFKKLIKLILADFAEIAEQTAD